MPMSMGSSSTSATGSAATARRTGWCSAWPAGSNTPTLRPITRPRRPGSRSNHRRSSAGATTARWETIEPHAGYPAGMPRLMTLDLTGKLTGPQCMIRIKTNMECYYDQAFIAVRDRAAEASLRVSTLPVARARLGYRGYTREISPDGRQPLIYDYDYVDPAPLARFSGKLTRYGDVARLLQADDDQLCLVGPGDEVQIEFDAVGPAASAAGLDAQLCRPWDRLLQGRRPVHGHQRHHRAAPLAGCRRFRSVPTSTDQRRRHTTRTCELIRPGPPGQA